MARGILLVWFPILAAGLAWASPAPGQTASDPLIQLKGCWAASGSVQGEPADSTLIVEPKLEGKFYLFRLSSLDRADPYDAEVTVGALADGRLRAFWTDTFGAEGAIQGDGRVE